MLITAHILDAYAHCPTKCFLRAHNEPGTGNIYAEWVRAENEAYRTTGIKRLTEEVTPDECVTGSAAANDLKTAKWRLATDVLSQTTKLESRIHAIERMPSEGRGKAAQFIPIRFVFRNILTKGDKLLLAFDALVLSELLGRPVTMGKIIHGDDHSTLKVKTASLTKPVGKLVEKITTQLSADKPPDLVLNRHCGECEFQTRCREKAIEKDDLSLLAGMSEKERKKLNSKGIFTITQLSYTFRPRRRPKKLRDTKEKYHHSLKALAIREKKIHIVGTPELKIEGTPVYFDVEGLPDRDFYYLIGMRIGNGDSAVQHSLWADTVKDEGKIWKQFLGILETVEKPVLIHYGSYETTFLKRMTDRYGLPGHNAIARMAVDSPVNLLSRFYGRLYFPTQTNGLKEIAAYLGHAYPTPMVAGINTVVWRHEWETTNNAALKNRLLEYNTKDCLSLEILLSELAKALKKRESAGDVVSADAVQNTATERGAGIHGDFELLLKSAHADYSEIRICLTTEQSERVQDSTRKRTRRANKRRKKVVKKRFFHVPRKRTCPVDASHNLQPSPRITSHTMLDLVFTKNGCRKTWVTYAGRASYCPSCQTTYPPPTVRRLMNQVYGQGFRALVIYQRVVLRLSYQLISKATQDVFGERLPTQTINGFLERAAKELAAPGNLLMRKVLGSPVIHVDETQLNVLGVNHYVWVMTDGHHVIFRLTETRETTFLKEMLAGYQGTLVTDFYGGYDAVPCSQQKCLVHLIRDLNDDLWKNPFATDYEQFVASIRDLLVPMFEDVRRFGLKACHLRKHIAHVDRFYADTILDDDPSSELIGKYQKRFLRYRESMFRFLEIDGIPWNNNAAERAIRHLAVQRKISGSFSRKGAERYLGLLAIAQTCRFQNKSFLNFLLSGSRDVDQYHEGHRK